MIEVKNQFIRNDDTIGKSLGLLITRKCQRLQRMLQTLENPVLLRLLIYRQGLSLLRGLAITAITLTILPHRHLYRYRNFATPIIRQRINIRVYDRCRSSE